MPPTGPAAQDPPSVDASLARLQQLRLRAEELIGDRLPTPEARPALAVVQGGGQSVAGQVAAVRQTVVALRTQHVQVRADLEAERERAAGLQARVAQLTADVETVLADLDAANHELETERSLHEQALESMGARFAEETARVAGHLLVLGEQLERERALVAAERSEREQVEAALRESARRCEELGDEVSRRDELLRRMTATANALRTQLDRIRDGVAAAAVPVPAPATTSLDELVERIERLKDQVRVSRDDDDVEP